MRVYGFQQAARVREWKTVRHAQGKALELYDLKNDLGEEEDVAISNAEVVREMEITLRNARSPYSDRTGFRSESNVVWNSFLIESGSDSPRTVQDP
jgi:hypothetical protein